MSNGRIVMILSKKRQEPLCKKIKIRKIKLANQRIKKILMILSVSKDSREANLQRSQTINGKTVTTMFKSNLNLSLKVKKTARTQMILNVWQDLKVANLLESLTINGTNATRKSRSNLSLFHRT